MLLADVAAVAATTLPWQYPFALDVTTVEAIVAATPPAVVGVVAPNDAVRG